MVSPVGDKFFVEATAGRLFLVCKACVIPHIWLQVLLPQNRFALCGFYFVQRYSKSGAEFYSPTPLCYLL